MIDGIDLLNPRSRLLSPVTVIGPPLSHGCPSDIDLSFPFNSQSPVPKAAIKPGPASTIKWTG